MAKRIIIEGTFVREEMCAMWERQHNAGADGALTLYLWSDSVRIIHHVVAKAGTYNKYAVETFEALALWTS